MTINIFILKGDLNGENRSGAFLFLSGISIEANNVDPEQTVTICSYRTNA